MTAAAQDYPLTTLPLSALIETRHDVIRHSAPGVPGGVALPGLRTGPRRGQGLEFIDLRQYNEGDDVRHIDWNVTARTNQPYTRLYREEIENTTTVIVDLREHMYTGSTVLRSVRAGLQAARMLWQASHAGDRVAAMTVTDERILETRPVAGRRGVLSACELISEQFAIKTNNLSLPLQHLLLRLTRSARQSGRYVVFSGFDVLGEAWQPRLDAVGVSGRVTGVMTIDRLEHKSLPGGRYTYHDHRGQTSTAIINRSDRAEISQQLSDNISSIRKSFRLSSVPLIIDDIHAPYADTLLSLLHGKS